MKLAEDELRVRGGMYRDGVSELSRRSCDADDEDGVGDEAWLIGGEDAEEDA